MIGTPGAERIGNRRVFATWWPLAASWLMMGFELPVVNAVMARLADPELSLAAYGGVVFPLSLLIEAPIIMLLAASTALSRDRPSYEKLRRFMWVAAASLTALHLAVAATPLYGIVVGRWIGAPREVLGPARIGLLIMTPWTAAIAYRRFQQGVLIRFGGARLVGVGTAVRLVSNVLVLVVGYRIGGLGIVVGTAAVATGVLCEALFIGFAVRPVLRNDLPAHDPGAQPLDRRSFLAFYVPLAATSLITLAALPIGSAAMSRLPRALDSLAVWPVLNGLTFMMRSIGFAYQEVVVALLDRPGSYPVLRRFAFGLAAAFTGVLALVAATPLSHVWFSVISALPDSFAALGRSALWIAVPMPATSVLMNWLNGVLVGRRQTRGVSEAVTIGLGTIVALLVVTVVIGRPIGLYAMISASVLGQSAQIAWLVRRGAASRTGSGGASAAGSSSLE